MSFWLPHWPHAIASVRPTGLGIGESYEGSLSADGATTAVFTSGASNLVSRFKAGRKLLAQPAEADEPPPLLHPSMADLYRTEIEELASALRREDTRLKPQKCFMGRLKRSS